MPEAGRLKKRKRLRRALIAAAVIFVLFVAVWYSGYPQRKTAEWAIERSTGLIAQIEWGGEFPELRMKQVYLFPSREAKRRGEPLISATDVRTQYSLLASGRKVKKVRIGELLVDADLHSEELRNLPILQRDPAKTDSGPIDSTFIPREVTVEDFAVRLHSEDGMFFLVDSIGIAVDVIDAETIEIRMASRPTRIVYDSGDGRKMNLENVAIDGQGKYSDGMIKWDQSLHEEGLFRVALDVAGHLTGDAPQLLVNVRECSVEGEKVAAVLESIQAPLRFTALTVESAQGTIGLGESAVSSLNLAARMYAPALPGAVEPMYGDALALTLAAEQGERLTADATLAFAQRQTVHAELRGTADEGELKAKIDEWTHAQVIDALPEAFREGVSGVRFDTFMTDATVRWTPETYSIDARAESKGGSADGAPIAWAVRATGARDGSQGIEGTAEARIGERRVTASARYESADHYLAEAVIEEVQIAPWVQLFAGGETAAQIEGTIQGTVRAEAKGQDAPLEIRPDITLKQFKYDTLALDEITAKGVMEYSRAEDRVAIAEFRAEAPDGMTAIALTNWEYEIESEVGGGAITGGADLGIVGRLIDEPDLYGAATLEGTVRIVGDRKELDFTTASDFFGMGDLQILVDSTLGGNVEYNADADTLILRGISAKIGEGTTIALGESRFTTSPMTGGGTATLASDLQVLVSLGWLAEAQGAASSEANFRIVDGAMHTDWTARMDAAALALPDEGGFTEGLVFSGTGKHDETGLTGTGEISATVISAAGGSVFNASGPVLFDGELMRIQQAKGDLFRGSINADIDVGVLTEGLPIKLDGSFAGADLAIFTDEVKPPRTELTGTAEGRISVGYNSDGLTAFSFEAVSPGQLSVNRSLVEELLQTDKFLSGAGANVAEKAMDKLLGTAPQRPFDRGQLTVQLAGDKITGLAILESEKTREYNGLNLRVTLDMDLSALAEALSMLQEASTMDVDN